MVLISVLDIIGGVPVVDDVPETEAAMSFELLVVDEGLIVSFVVEFFIF
jgi:hypothetical protein